MTRMHYARIEMGLDECDNPNGNPLGCERCCGENLAGPVVIA